jgi:Uma2 family endonuclease
MATVASSHYLEIPSIHIPADAYTLAGFRRWAISDEFPERGRISFLDGEIEIDMSPEEIRAHSDPKTELTHKLLNIVKANDLGQPLIDGALLVNEPANVSNEPDFMFCSWEAIESGRVQFPETFPGSGRQMEVVGSPDLVVEVVSQSSVRKDRVILRERYHAAGISEYWIVDCLEQEPKLEILVWAEGGYVPAVVEADGWQVSTVMKHQFRLCSKVDRLGRVGVELQLQPSSTR